MNDLNQYILVTGGTGFVGGALLRRIHDDGIYLPRAAVRQDSVELPSGIEVIKVAGLNADTDWSIALNNVNVVIHAAGLVHVMGSNESEQLDMYRAINVDGTMRLAMQAAAAGVRRFIFLSSVKVNGEGTQLGLPFRETDKPQPEDAYAKSKYEAETALLSLAMKSGMEVTIIRPPLVYGTGVKGNFAKMIAWLKKGIPLPLGAVTKNKRSFVALDNLVDLIVTCIEHPAAANEVFLAGDGEDLSTKELLTKISTIMGVTAHLIPVPVAFLKAIATITGKRNTIHRLCGSLQVDITKAKTLLGWHPHVSVHDGLRKALGGSE